MRILDARISENELRQVVQRHASPDSAVARRVSEILAAVQSEGDEALTTFTRQFDCKFIDSLGLRVSRREIMAAYPSVSKSFIKALRLARRRIVRFHRKQVPESWTLKDKGVRLRQRFLPLERVGVYVPGGKAAYPSTVLMNALPARVAGVKEIVMVTPCNQEGKIAAEVLVAAAECGVGEVYRIGGAQAIAALAFGTESIPRVDKITGPGNAYVAAAKQHVFGRVGIDMIAGPTEVVILADVSAQAKIIAADLIAQAEHDESASPVVVTPSTFLAQQIGLEVEIQLEHAPRKSIARRALEENGLIILVQNLKQGVEVVNMIAPEHLEVMVKNPSKILAAIRNAGSIFVGEWATEAMGDYIAGTNHTLPTGGTARFSSPLSVMDFMKFTNVIEVNRKAFLKLAPHVETLAEAEGLDGHADSVRIRRGEK